MVIITAVSVPGSIAPERFIKNIERGVTMWRVDWYGSFAEFSRIFDTEIEAVEFYNSLITSRKTIYEAF